LTPPTLSNITKNGTARPALKSGTSFSLMMKQSAGRSDTNRSRKSRVSVSVNALPMFWPLLNIVCVSETKFVSIASAGGCSDAGGVSDPLIDSVYGVFANPFFADRNENTLTKYVPAVSCVVILSGLTPFCPDFFNTLPLALSNCMSASAVSPLSWNVRFPRPVTVIL
jgi:hypothetical protein